MYIVYGFNRVVNEEPQRDLIILFYPKSMGLVEVERALHKIGLDYCMNQNGGSVPTGGLSFDQLMEVITPQMLAPHGMSMIRPYNEVVRLDNAPPVVGSYELETYQEARHAGDYNTRWVCEISQQFARRLETQRKNGHPAISTWAPDIISVKAVTWAGQFVVTGKENWESSDFFKKKLQEAKPHTNNNAQTPADTGEDDHDVEGQADAPISQ